MVLPSEWALLSNSFELLVTWTRSVCPFSLSLPFAALATIFATYIDLRFFRDSVIR